MAKDKGKIAEIDGFSEIVQAMDANHQKVAEKILQRLRFMESTLKNLERQIDEEGAVIVSKNGNGFETIGEHPAQKSYNTMIGRYNALIKTFMDLIPDGAPEQDALMEFIGGGAN
nr:hypothetical protein [uncultured Anaerotignum sp.]